MTPASILAARLDALVARSSGLPADLADELGELAALAGGLEDYAGRFTSPASPALQRLADATARRDWDSAPGGLEQEMLSGHVEGQFLGMLVHVMRARRVLEIGMFTGYSALAMAEALPADGVVMACELDADVARFACEQFDASPAGSRVDVRVGPANDTLAALAVAGETFDLVFVDADKPGYTQYVTTVLDHGLLAPHGLLAVDNTLMQGQPWTGERSANGEAIARFNEVLAADPRVEQVLVPLRDGVTLARRVDAS